MVRVGAKVLQYTAVLLVAFTLNFLLPHLAPGDPVGYTVGAVGSLDAAQLDQVRAEFGLDKPLPQQYLQYWRDLVRGDLGTSVRLAQPVRTVLVQRVGWTILLVGTATVASTMLGIMAAVLAAWRRRDRDDLAAVITVLGIDAMPAFWIAMVLSGVFAVELGWFPSFGATPFGAVGVSWLAGVAHRLVLPALALTVAGVGGTFLLTRGTMLDTFGAPHVRMAVAKGVDDRAILFRHVLRTSLLPTYTHVALGLGAVLGGSVVVETVFAYPGLGRLIFQSAISRDYPVLRGSFVLLTVGVVAANLIADLTYPLLDPRVRRPRSPVPG
ncbi:MAG: ABC transporter permease [Euzebya sp.]